MNDLENKELLKIEEEKKNIDLSIFNGSIMEFHQALADIPDNIIGHFQIKRNKKSRITNVK